MSEIYSQLLGIETQIIFKGIGYKKTYFFKERNLTSGRLLQGNLDHFAMGRVADTVAAAVEADRNCKPFCLLLLFKLRRMIISIKL